MVTLKKYINSMALARKKRRINDIGLRAVIIPFLTAPPKDLAGGHCWYLLTTTGDASQCPPGSPGEGPISCQPFTDQPRLNHHNPIIGWRSS
jgi:hypothetical protein